MIHDHFLPFRTLHNGEIAQLGGYARLQSAINEERQKNPGCLLLDAGDYSMGTLFQTLFASDGAGLRIMGKMGYDVVTLLSNPNSIALVAYAIVIVIVIVIAVVIILVILMMIRRKKRRRVYNWKMKI